MSQSSALPSGFDSDDFLIQTHGIRLRHPSDCLHLINWLQDEIDSHRQTIADLERIHEKLTARERERKAA